MTWTGGCPCSRQNQSTAAWLSNLTLLLPYIEQDALYRSMKVNGSVDKPVGPAWFNVPENYRAVPGFALSPGQWEELQIPVAVAFFFLNSREERVVGFYPSPAGATESLLPMDAWERLTSANPELANICSDVEALLVRAPAEGYVVPIDACYELVGHMRRLWQGFDGGQEARAEMNAFFARVKARSASR